MVKILILVVMAWLLFGCSSIQKVSDDNQPTPVISETIGEPTASEDSEVQIPEDWTWMYDGQHEFAMAYPNSWIIRPATNAQSESAIYSFDPSQNSKIEGIPIEELKIAVVKFLANDQRQISYENADI